MLRIVGTGGEIQVGYEHAGTIARWELTSTLNQGAEVDISLELVLSDTDPYWSQQRPVTVSIDWFGRRRVWREVVPDTTEPHWRFTALPLTEMV